MSQRKTTWTIKKIRDLVKAKFKKRACLFQVKVAFALRERKNDVVAIAATGSGKTLSFWIPLGVAVLNGLLARSTIELHHGALTFLSGRYIRRSLLMP